MKNKPTVSVMGMWHLGCVYAASLAKLGYSVTCFDYDEETIKNLMEGKPPLFEPGLEETLEKYKKNLTYTSEEVKACQKADYIFITFDLPVDNKDHVDVTLINRAIKTIKKYHYDKSTVVVSSQVPVGTCRRILRTFGTGKINIIYFPENLRLGNAFDSFLKADRIVLGSDSAPALAKFQEDFAPLKTDFVTMGLESAEMVKHALNAYLATCISFSSEMSDICERVGGNMNDVVRALKTDKRVSQFAPLNPGLGFAGGTLGRDIQSLTTIAESINYKPSLFPAVYRVNSTRLAEVMNKIQKCLKAVKGKKIGILGLTYKPGTDTLRRSMSLGLADKIHKEGGKVFGFDPKVTESIQGQPYITLTKSAEELAQQVDMLILMTEWPEFKEINPKKLTMKRKLLLDTKNFLDTDAFQKEGFTVLGTGY